MLLKPRPALAAALALALSAHAGSVTVIPGPAPRVRVEAGTGISIANDGGSYAISLSTDGGCVAATDTHGGCVTIDDQTLAGRKSFADGISLSGRYATIEATYNDLGIYFRDNVTASSPGASFTFQTRATRTNGPVASWYNGLSPVMYLDYGGNLTLSGGGAFYISGAQSGSMHLLGPTDTYLAIGARFAPNYWGHHGATQVGNYRKMESGFLFEIYNALSGTGAATDHIILVNYKGGFETQANLTAANLPPCDGHDVSPPGPNNRYSLTVPLGCTPHWLTEDGGSSTSRYISDGGVLGYSPTAALPDGGTGVCYDWTTATDAGHAQVGSLQLLVVDVLDPNGFPGVMCICKPAYFDGGHTSSWRKAYDYSECRP